MLLGQIETRPQIHHPTDPSKDREFARAYYFEMMRYKIHAQEVMDFHLSDEPIRIVSAPARTSKSFSAAMEIIVELMPTIPITTSRTWIVGPTFNVMKEFDYIYEELVLKDTFTAHGMKITKAHNNPNNGDMLIVIDWGKDKSGTPCQAIIEGMSSKNLPALQGEDVSMFCPSESAEHEEVIWTKYLASRFLRAIFPTTPKPYADWIYKMVTDSATNPALGIAHFQYPPSANPHYNYKRFERAKISAASRTESGDAADDPFFAEQFLGLWGSYYTGQVIPFRKDRHVVELDPRWLRSAKIFVSCDHGYRDPAVALFWATMPSGAHLIFDEVYERGLTTQKFVERIEDKLHEHGVHDQVSYVTGDPKKPEVEDYLRQTDLNIFTMNKNKQADRALGHRLLVDLLSVDPERGHPMLFLSTLCEKTRKEWEGLRYRDGVANEYGTSAFEGNVRDDAFDAARYGAATMPEPLAAEQEQDWLEHVMTQHRLDQQMMSSGRWADTGCQAGAY